MSDLVSKLRLMAEKRYIHNLKSLTISNADTANKAADRIEQLERELAEAQRFIFESGREAGKLQAELAAEKALTDRLYEAWMSWCDTPEYMNNEDRMVMEDYRKARGL